MVANTYAGGCQAENGTDEQGSRLTSRRTRPGRLGFDAGLRRPENRAAAPGGGETHRPTTPRPQTANAARCGEWRNVHLNPRAAPFQSFLASAERTT
jgi:hypothetical protein